MMFTTSEEHHNSSYNPIAENLFSLTERGFLHQNGYFDP